MMNLVFNNASAGKPEIEKIIFKDDYDNFKVGA